MLRSLIKDLVGRGAVNVPQTQAQANAHGLQSTREALKPTTHHHLASHGIGLVVESRSGAFHGVMHAWKEKFEASGIKFSVIDVQQQGWESLLLEAVAKGVRFALGPAGAGAGLSLGVGEDFWESNGIPLLKILGDHPCYYPDRHVQTSNAHASVYAFPEHRAFFEKWIRPISPCQGVSVLLPIATLGTCEIDETKLAHKASGRIAFFKNGNNPEALRKAWKTHLPEALSDALLSIGMDASNAIGAKSPASLESRVIEYFEHAPGAINIETGLLCFIVAQLDDLVRREKSTLLGRVLRDYPVDIFGDFWEHVDFTRGEAQHLGSGTYLQMVESMKSYLAIVDMSPNIDKSVHERLYHAATHYTVCISNRTDYLAERFPELARYAYEFSEASIRRAIEKVLKDPDTTVENGVRAGQRFRREFPDRDFVRVILNTADLVHAKLRSPRVQDFNVWLGTLK